MTIVKEKKVTLAMQPVMTRNRNCNLIQSFFIYVFYYASNLLKSTHVLKIFKGNKKCKRKN